MIPDDDRQVSQLVTIIPAEPGWFVASFIQASESKTEAGKTYAAGFVDDAIIAWEIRRERMRYHPSHRPGETFVACEVYALTVDGRVDLADWEDSGQPKLLKRPDGCYEAVGNCVFETWQEAAQHLAGVLAERCKT